MGGRRNARRSRTVGQLSSLLSSHPVFHCPIVAAAAGAPVGWNTSRRCVANEFGRVGDEHSLVFCVRVAKSLCLLVTVADLRRITID